MNKFDIDMYALTGLIELMSPDEARKVQEGLTVEELGKLDRLGDLLLEVGEDGTVDELFLKMAKHVLKEYGDRVE